MALKYVPPSRRLPISTESVSTDKSSTKLPVLTGSSNGVSNLTSKQPVFENRPVSRPSSQIRVFHPIDGFTPEANIARRQQSLEWLETPKGKCWLQQRTSDELAFFHKRSYEDRIHIDEVRSLKLKLQCPNCKKKTPGWVDHRNMPLICGSCGGLLGRCPLGVISCDWLPVNMLTGENVKCQDVTLHTLKSLR